MTRAISDQNKVVQMFESGTYAGSIAVIGNASDRWIGHVQSFSIDEQENPIENRTLGNSDRSYFAMDKGPRDVTATLTYNPQDFRIFAHAIGSAAESNSGSNTICVATEIDTNVIQNPYVSGTGNDLSLPYSMTFEDSKQAPGAGANFIRTVRGCVINTASLNLSPGEKASVELEFVGQTLDFSSGTTTTATENSTVEPYTWSDAVLTLSGTAITTAKDVSLEIAQNIEAPHYMNGSRVIGKPFPQNRDYTLSVTADLDTANGKTFHDIYKAGTAFNSDITLSKISTGDTGSQWAEITMSGCVITTFEAPSEVEGVNEYTMEIRPKHLIGSFAADVNYIGSYNPY